MNRMSADAKERLRDAAERRKSRERYARWQTYVAATPRILVARFGPSSPRLEQAGEVMFEPAHEEKFSSLNMSGRGPLFGPMQTRQRPDGIRIGGHGSTISQPATKAGGIVVRPRAEDLRRYDAIGARIVRLQRERRDLLDTMAQRGRPLTADETVALAKQNWTASEAGFIRPESLAKKVRLPR
jgi:hypothetical protein